jgi:hypothetical protein
MHKKILFLDIDGVLNSEQSAHYWNERGKENGGFSKRNPEFCPLSVCNLKYVLKQIPDLQIVVSSTWRIGSTLQELKDTLSKHAGVDPERVIDTTPFDGHFGRIRGKEIQAWLDLNPTEKFAIVDDDSDMEHLMDHLIHTSWREGFMRSKAIAMIDFFNT